MSEKKRKSPIIIHIPAYNRRVYHNNGDSIASSLRSQGVPIDTPCGGRGLCGGCLIKVRGNNLPVLDADRRLIPEESLREGYRLACRPRYLDSDVTIEIPVKKREINLSAIPQRIVGNYAFSVDLGTTTIAISLLNIDEGVEIGSLSFTNPQTSYGADVITRATLVMEDRRALHLLRRLAINSINSGFKRLIMSCRVDPSNVKQISIAGNSIMEHILLGYSPVPLTLAPFKLSVQFPQKMKGRDIHFDGFEDADVFLFPMAGANIGGDTIAGIYYLDMLENSEPAILLDIGTNVEMVLSKSGALYATSSPAGPAFEGGEITFGMRAEEGAIEYAKVEGDSIVFRVHGGGRPKGICGSGLISLVAELLNAGVIDNSGYIRNREEIPSNLALRVQSGERGNIFVIHRDTKLSLYITQMDIRQLQLAKAALMAGINILLKKTGTKSNEIRTVYLAGAFGTAVDQESIFRIGMLSKNFKGKLIPAGDTALGGAKKFLLENTPENILREILDRTTYLELSKESEFEKEFLRRMNFREED